MHGRGSVVWQRDDGTVEYYEGEYRDGKKDGVGARLLEGVCRCDGSCEWTVCVSRPRQSLGVLHLPSK